MTAPHTDLSAGLLTEEMESDLWRNGRYLVVSDLHLGSRYCLREAFVACLERLPPGMALVLNGDIVDRVHERLPAVDAAVLDRLREEACRREIVWIYGNHDAGFLIDSPGNIRFVNELVIDRKLYVAHGHGFDNVMPAHRWFVRTFRAMHRLRVLMGAEAIHVAAYAKRWNRLYRVLREHVQRNAVSHARRRGCLAVACGHTHFVEEKDIQDIHYFNTGSWTELPVYGLCVGADEIHMLKLAV